MVEQYFSLKLDRKTKKPADIKHLVSILTDNLIKQECIEDMVREISGEKDYYLETFKHKFLKKKKENSGKYYPNTISSVWLSLLNAGLIHRERKGAPVILSKGFSSLLRRVADYWDEYVEAEKNFTKSEGG